MEKDGLQNLDNTVRGLESAAAVDRTNKTSFYFDTALGISFTLCLIMAILLGLTILDLDKCESTFSPNCPYFTNPEPGAKVGAPEVDFRTTYNGNPLPPDPYNF